MSYVLTTTQTGNITVNGLWYAYLNSNLIETTTSSGYNISINESCCALGGGGSGGDGFGDKNGKNGKHGIFNTVTIANIYNYGCLAGGGGGGAGSYFKEGDFEGIGYGGNGGAGGGGGSWGPFDFSNYPVGADGGGASGSSYTSSGSYSTTSDNGSGGGFGLLSTVNNPGGKGYGSAGTGSKATTNNDIINGGQGGGSGQTTIDGKPGFNGGGGGGGGQGGGGGAGGGGGGTGEQGTSAGGGSGGGDSTNGAGYKGGTGGYGIYNTGTITNLYNVQGLTSSTSDGISFGPLFYGGSGISGITNYYIKITSSTVYGQLYNIGVNAVTGLSVTFAIDNTSTISFSSTSNIYYNVLVNVIPSSKSGIVPTNSNLVWQLIKKTVTLQGIDYPNSYDLLIMNKTGFIAGSTDLSLLLQGYISGSQTVTGLTTKQSPYTGQDLGSIFQPQLGGTLVTQIINITGQDLGSLFQNL